MRKVIYAIIAAVICFSLTASAQESSVDITNRSLDLKSRELVISGNVEAPKGKVSLVLTVEKDGRIIFSEDGVSGDINESSISEFTFDSFKFSDAFSSGDYKFTIYAEFINELASFEISYLTDEEWFEFLKDINSAISSNNETTAKTLIGNNIKATDVSSEYYEKIGDAEKSLIAKSVMKKSYTLPATLDTAADVEKLLSAVSEYKAACTEGVIYAELSAVKSEADFRKWWNKYDAGIGLSADNTKTTTDESAVIKDYFETEVKKTAFLKRLPGCAKVLDKSKLQEEIIEAIMLAKIETSNAQVVGGMVSKYSSYMGITKVGTSVQSSAACSKVCMKPYDTLPAFAKAYGDALPSGDGGGSTGGAGGGTGGGGGGGSAGSGSLSTSNAVIQDFVNGTDTKNDLSSAELPFTDMEGFDWAYDAVDFLYKRSVISGRDKTSFDPNASVTRAEFIKMLVVAYGYEAKVTDPLDFSDVPADAWYGEYLRQAVKVGLVKGDDRNCFNPDATLTREDMAVMVQRASLFEKGSKEINFSDKNEISEYAYDSIEILYNKSVVSGMGDGRFAPKEAVTRAQAAQILYNVLINTYK